MNIKLYFYNSCFLLFYNSLKPGRLLPAPKEPRQSANTLFNVLCMTGLGTSSHTFCLAYVCSPIYFNWQLGFFQHVCRACTSPENPQYSGYCHYDAFIYLCFQKDYLHKVHNVLSNSQRLLRQACTS